MKIYERDGSVSEANPIWLGTLGYSRSRPPPEDIEYEVPVWYFGSEALLIDPYSPVYDFPVHREAVAEPEEDDHSATTD